MKAVVASFNQEKAVVGAFSVIANLRMELFEALLGRPGPGLGTGTGDDYEIWSWAPLQSEATLQERQIV